MSRIITRLILQISANSYGSGGIQTHASEMTGALNQRLRPLGHTTYETFADLLLKQ